MHGKIETILNLVGIPNLFDYYRQIAARNAIEAHLQVVCQDLLVAKQTIGRLQSEAEHLTRTKEELLSMVDELRQLVRTSPSVQILSLIEDADAMLRVLIPPTSNEDMTSEAAVSSTYGKMRGVRNKLKSMVQIGWPEQMKDFEAKTKLGGRI